MSTNLRETAIRQFLEQAAGHEDCAKPARSLPIQARVLRDLLPHVLRPNPFEVGNLVVQTKRYEQYRWPEEGAVAIVTAVFPPRPPANSEEGNRFDREDMVVLVNVSEKWVEFAVESWRFELYAGDVEGCSL